MCSMTYNATAVPSLIATAQNDGKYLKTNWNLLPPGILRGFCRLVTDGCQPTTRERCIGFLTTLERIEDRPTAPLDATAVHCFITRFPLRVPITYSSPQGGCHGND